MKLEKLKKYIKRSVNSAIKLPGLAILAVAMLGGCAADNLQEPEALGNTPMANGQETGGSLYFSVDVIATGDPGTRTQTDFRDEMDRENGQGIENSINSVKIILVSKTDSKVIATFSSYKEDDKDGKTTAYFRKDYSELQALVNAAGSAGEVDAKVFVICNAPESYSLPDDGTEDFQEVMEVSDFNDISTYGGPTSYFLMTNGDYASTDNEDTQYDVKVKISELRQCTDEEKAYPLSKTGLKDATQINIPVQRALARFDIGGTMPDYIYYFDENGFALGKTNDTNKVPAGTKVMLTIRYLGFANVNKKFNLFKETGTAGEGGVKSNWDYFRSEPGNYVFDPAYADKKTALSNTGDGLKRMNNYYNNALMDPEWLDDGYFLNLQNIFNNEPLTDGYRVLGYCVPNTIHEANMQKNGITTAIVLAARLNFVGGLGEGTSIPSAEGGDEKYKETPIYMWGGKFYGTNRSLLQSVLNKANSKDLLMAEAYQKAANDARGETVDRRVWENRTRNKSYSDTELLSAGAEPANATEEQKVRAKDERFDAYNALPIPDFARALVANGFSIYMPINFTNSDNIDDWEYGCLYYYWNRHNDNLNEEVMGPMEFNVVRNNIYKLKLLNVTGFGHPIPSKEIDTDPDPLDPWTDDEVPGRYLQIDSRVKEWGLRYDDNTTLY